MSLAEVVRLPHFQSFLDFKDTVALGSVNAALRYETRVYDQWKTTYAAATFRSAERLPRPLNDDFRTLCRGHRAHAKGSNLSAAEKRDSKAYGVYQQGGQPLNEKDLCVYEEGNFSGERRSKIAMKRNLAAVGILVGLGLVATGCALPLPWLIGIGIIIVLASCVCLSHQNYRLRVAAPMAVSYHIPEFDEPPTAST